MSAISPAHASGMPAGRRGKLACALVGLLALLAVALLEGPTPARAAEAQATVPSYRTYQRRVLGINSSLHCERTTSLASTADGALWVGTYDGVYRFDGRDMDRVDLGAVHAVNSLYVGADDYLWVGTNDNGIAVVKDGQLVATLKRSEGLPTNTVKALAGDGEGKVYAGTSDTVVTLALEEGEDGAQRVVIKGEAPSVERPESMAAADPGTVAAVDGDGFLALLEGGEAVDVRLPGDDFLYTAAAFGPDGLLYVGRDDGAIDLFDVSQGGLQQVSQLSVGRRTGVNSIFFTEGTLFACTEEGAAYAQVAGTDAGDGQEAPAFAWIEASDFNGSVLSMAQDFQGNLWLASPRIGLMELYRSPAIDLFQASGLSETVVNTEAAWGGLLYLGTDRGLECVDPTTYDRADNDLSNDISGVSVQCLLTDSAGSLWICTLGQGVIRVGADGTRTAYASADGLFGMRVLMAIELADGRVAVCGDDGITMIAQDGHIEESLVHQTGNAAVLCLAELGDGTLLAGTDGDGVSLVANGQVTRVLTKEDGLSSDTVRRLTPSPRAGVVFAVTNNGIDALTDVSGDCQVRELDGLPAANDYNVRVLEDGTALVPSSDGLYVCKEQDLLSDARVIDHVLLNEEWGISEALTADACNCIDQDNNFYLATSVGAYVVNLKDYDQIDVDYRVGVGDVTLDRQEGFARPGEDLKVGSDVQRVTIEPEVLNFNVTDPTIRYYLEGYDKEKTTVPYSQLQEITYTNLPAGTYALHLEVLDSSGDVQAQTTCQLVKEEGLLDQGWFRALVLAAAAALVFVLAWVWAGARNRRRLRREEARHDEEMRIKERQLQTANEGVMAIAKALDARDRYTSQHSERVSLYSSQIGAKLGMSAEERENLRKVALLHDIGKIGVPDAILNKPGRLTDEEYAIIKRHVDYGAEILSNFTGLDHVVEGAQYHHERYDGKGYTHGLAGEEIPLYGRIIGVADAFDAMTSNRVYRGHLDIEEVLAELERCRGTQFDPRIADIMIDLVRSGEVDLTGLYGETGGQAD